MDTNRVLAVSSGGGHWTQLCRLKPAFEDAEIVYATVSESFAEDVPGHEFHLLPDATRWDRLAMVRLTASVFRILVAVRPDVVVSTGAAPGAVAVLLAPLVGARALFIDSVANVEHLSVSGRIVLRSSATVFTQWPQLATPTGARYSGAIL